MKAVASYNSIMFDICHEHCTIGTRYSEGTGKWNLRDMVSEMQYTLDLWNDKECIPWLDAHDTSQPVDKPWLKAWRSEIARMRRFIAKYKGEALTMECTEKHCSIYD